MKQVHSPVISPNDKSRIPRRGRVESCLYILAAFIALLGLSDSIYLTVQHLAGRDVDCIAFAACETVLTSRYAAIGKIPLAAFGALAYFAAFSLATLAAFGREWTRRLFICLVGVMMGATCWLLYLQALVLHAFCDFCLLSAALTTILAAIGLVIFFTGKNRPAVIHS